MIKNPPAASAKMPCSFFYARAVIDADNGVQLGTFTPSNRHFFLQKIIEPIIYFFKLGKRKIGPLEGKIKLEFVGDWEISPEELFEDMDDLRLCKTP